MKAKKPADGHEAVEPTITQSSTDTHAKEKKTHHPKAHEAKPEAEAEDSFTSPKHLKVNEVQQLVLTPEATLNRARKNFIHLRALVKRPLDAKKWNKVLALTKEITRDTHVFQNLLTGNAKDHLIANVKQFSSYNPSGDPQVDLPKFQKTLQTEVSRKLKELNEMLGDIKLHHKKAA